MKIVINRCYGGFGLSPEALLWLHKSGAAQLTPYKKYYGIDDSERGQQNKALYAYDLAKFKEYMAHGGDFLVTVFDESGENIIDYIGPRDHHKLVECIETLGEKSFGECAKLKIVEVPDGIEWEVNEYDGMEVVEERHRSWG